MRNSYETFVVMLAMQPEFASVEEIEDRCGDLLERVVGRPRLVTVLGGVAGRRVDGEIETVVDVVVEVD